MISPAVATPHFTTFLMLFSDVFSSDCPSIHLETETLKLLVCCSPVLLWLLTLFGFVACLKHIVDHVMQRALTGIWTHCEGLQSRPYFTTPFFFLFLCPSKSVLWGKKTNILSTRLLDFDQSWHRCDRDSRNIAWWGREAEITQIFLADPCNKSRDVSNETFMFILSIY